MQEVIIYQGPADYAMWQLIQNSPNAFPVMVGVAVMLVSFGFINSKTPRYHNYSMKLVFAATLGVAVASFLWI